MAYDPAPDNLDLVLEKSVGLPHVDGFDWEVKRTLQSLLPGVRYSIRVRAYNHFNVYSGWSDALEFTAPFDTGRPVAIIGLRGTYESGDAILAWHVPTRTTDDKTCNNISHYELVFQFKDDNGDLQITRRYVSPVNSFTLPFYQQVLENETTYPNLEVSVVAVTTSDSRSDPTTISLVNSPPSVGDFESLVGTTSGIQIVMTLPDSVLDFHNFVLESSNTLLGGPWEEVYSGISNIFLDIFEEATLKFYRYKIVDKLGQESQYSDVRSEESLDSFTGTIEMGDLTDVDLTGLVQPSVLEWNGTAWVPVQYNILGTEGVQDIIASTLVEGDNVTIEYDDSGNIITISATGGGGGVAQSYSAVVGDGVTTDFEVVHGFGSENFVFSIYDYLTGESVSEQVTIIDENTVEVNFGVAPDINSRKIVLIAADPETDAHLYPLDELYPSETIYPLG